MDTFALREVLEWKEKQYYFTRYEENLTKIMPKIGKNERISKFKTEFFALRNLVDK